jgi:hypothetical protein
VAFELPLAPGRCVPSGPASDTAKPWRNERGTIFWVTNGEGARVLLPAGRTVCGMVRVGCREREGRAELEGAERSHTPAWALRQAGGGGLPGGACRMPPVPRTAARPHTGLRRMRHNHTPQPHAARQWPFLSRKPPFWTANLQPAARPVCTRAVHTHPPRVHTRRCVGCTNRAHT